MMKIGSLFDGSGGFPLAASMCGIEPVWASEVEPYPIAVTRSRFPNMKHLGSVTDVKGDEVEPVDVITFGSPCQDLSVAGKRAGLKHTDNGDDETTRSGLFMEAVRIIKEMREATNGAYPRFALWENVPGAFSSNKGEDFRIVLEEFIKIVEPTAVMPAVPKNGWPYADSYCGDGWSLAYRVFDAQFWGVPQRRRRIYLVADFRGQCAGKVSFEREGLRGYFAQSGTPWKAVAGDAESGVGTADCGRNGIINLNKGDVQSKTILDPDGIAPALYAGECRFGGGECYVLDKANDFNTVTYALDQQGGKGGANYAEEVMPTLCSDSHGTPHAVAHPVGFDTYNMVATGDKTVTLRAGSEYNYAPVFVPYTLKIRSGCEGGGKGALIQTDKSATLSTLNDQYLFQPILDDQGGSQISVRTDGKCPTLRAEMHGNVPAVMEPITLEPGIASREGGHIYEGVCGTLRANAGDNQMAVAYSIENHPADSRVNIDDSGKVQTLTSRMGTGGGNVPMVMEPIAISSKQQSLVTSANAANTLGANDYKEPQAVVYCLQGNGIDRADTAGCNGKGWNDKTCYTLNTIDRPAVAYAMQGFGDYKENDAASGLKARDYKDATDLVVYADTVGSLCARDYKGVGSQYVGEDKLIISKTPIRYIVRRLTPTECARLQGFPDKWGHPDVKTELTDEEYKFWLDVRNTHAEINGKATKEYTREQMLTWYSKLHTDSSEYKMWGNGIALPCALYVMQGIVDALSKEE